MKRCGRCGEMRPLGDFYVCRSAPDGRQGKCKPCDREASREWQRANPEKAKARTARDRQRNAERRRESVRAYRARHPERIKANKAIRSARRRGDLQPPSGCESCGREAHLLEGHHADYSKPLEVEWLCRSCHKTNHLGAVAA